MTENTNNVPDDFESDFGSAGVSGPFGDPAATEAAMAEIPDLEIEAEVVDAEPVPPEVDVEPVSKDLIIPATGQMLSLDDPDEVLAKASVEISDLIAKLKDEALTPIGAELLNRLDQGALTTMRTNLDDGTQYEIKAPSQTAGTENYDAGRLEAELLELLAANVINEDAAAGALKRTVTVTLQVPFLVPGMVDPNQLEALDVDALVERLRAITQVAGTPVTVASVNPSRATLMPGINRLRKTGRCNEHLDRAKNPDLEPSRKVTVKKLTVNGAKAGT